MNNKIGAALWIFFLMMAFPVAEVLAQVPQPLALPNLTIAGSVYVVAKQPDGGIVFAGFFSSVNGVARKDVARLLPSGALDLNWNPSPNSFGIQRLVTDDAGRVYIAGGFTQIGGQTRSGLARLSAGAAGLADAAWVPPSLGSGSFIDALALSPDGYLYVANDGSRRLVRIATGGTGALDPVWSPSIEGSVRVILPFNDGNIYVGGVLLSNQPNRRGCLARISASGTGTVDTSWQGDADIGWNGCSVYAIATYGGALFVGGSFDTINSNFSAHNNLAKILPQGTGALDNTWTTQLAPNSQQSIGSLAVDGRGSIFVGGRFNAICQGSGIIISCRTQFGLAKLSTASSGAVDETWKPCTSLPSSSFFPSIVVTADTTGLIVTDGNNVDGVMVLGTQTRQGVAVLPTQSEQIFRSGFE